MRNRTRFTVRTAAMLIGVPATVAVTAAGARGSVPPPGTGLAAGAVSGREAAPAASAHCHFQPHFPARVPVGQDVVGVVGRLTITGTGCAHYYDVSTRLIHETDDHGYSWTTPYTTDSEVISAATLRPGRYRTTGWSCIAENANNQPLTCVVGTASSLIKFAAQAHLTGHRSGRTITFHARARKYEAYTGFVGMTDVVQIQRLIPRTHTWRTVHRAKAGAKAGYTWRYVRRAPATYRAVAAPTAATFSATSAPIKR